jgi:hypothetical protein
MLEWHAALGRGDLSRDSAELGGGEREHVADRGKATCPAASIEVRDLVDYTRLTSVRDSL